MHVSEAIETRRAVKNFDPDYIMPQADVDRLLSLAMLSPTAFNIQHWRFVVVTDKDLRSDIRAATFMQAQITDASLLVVLCVDLKAWQKEPGRYWRNVPAENRDGIVEAIGGFYEGRETMQRDEAMRSCGIAAQSLMLAATEMGYQSCPMDLGDFDAVAKLINLPDDHAIGMYVAIGKGIKEPWPRGGQLPIDEVVIENRFPA